MKKVGLSDTVLVEIAQKLRVARVKFGVFTVAKIPGKKTKISRNFESEGFLKSREKHIMAVSILLKHSGLTALGKQRPSYVNFSLDFGIGIVLEIIVKV